MSRSTVSIGISKMNKPLRLAIVHEPEEVEPPSKHETLNYIIKVAEKFGVEAQLKTLDSIKLGDVDAIFIRQTTAFNSPIYNLSKLASSVGIVVIDDPISIEVCCNKITMATRFAIAGVPIPTTGILEPEWGIHEAAETLGYPLVLKDPASCFSHGVMLVNNPNEIEEVRAKMQAITAGPILVQEFIPSSFDWRVGVLDSKILFCCQYKMARGHWQIIKRTEKGQEEGGSVTLNPNNYPREICQLALHAASCVGDGLYGVDIKVGPNGPVVIEINDNPSIDRGIEDRHGVWPRVINHFKEKVNGRKTRQAQNAGRKLLQLWGHYLNANC